MSSSRGNPEWPPWLQGCAEPTKVPDQVRGSAKLRMSPLEQHDWPWPQLPTRGPMGEIADARRVDMLLVNAYRHFSLALPVHSPPTSRFVCNPYSIWEPPLSVQQTTPTGSHKPSPGFSYSPGSMLRTQAQASVRHHHSSWSSISVL
jgi:hypothetical protein